MVTAADNPASTSIQSFASDFQGVDLPVFDDSHNNEPRSPNDIALGKNFYKPECVLLVMPFPPIIDERFNKFSIGFILQRCNRMNSLKEFAGKFNIARNLIAFLCQS